MLIHAATRRIIRKGVLCRPDAEVLAINQMNVGEGPDEFDEVDEVELDG